MRTKSVCVGDSYSRNARAFTSAADVQSAQAAEPKHGGILQSLSSRDSAQPLDPRRGDVSVNVPAMGVFNNLVIYDQHKPQNSHGHDRARTGDQLGLEQATTRN